MCAVKKCGIKFNVVYDLYLLGVVCRFCGFTEQIINQLSIQGDADKTRLFFLGLGDDANNVDDIGGEIELIRSTSPAEWDAMVDPLHVENGVRSIELAVVKHNWIEAGINDDAFSVTWYKLWVPEITEKQAYKLWISGKDQGKHWDPLHELLEEMRVKRDECR